MAGDLCHDKKTTVVGRGQITKAKLDICICVKVLHRTVICKIYLVTDIFSKREICLTIKKKGKTEGGQVFS